MNFIRKFFEKHPSRRQIKCTRYKELIFQLQQVEDIQDWLKSYICENPKFNPYFFKKFFTKVCVLPFDDVPFEATSRLFYFDASQQPGPILIPWDEAEAEYTRLRNVGNNMNSFEQFVNSKQVERPYLQSIFWARQTATKLRIYVDIKEKELQEEVDALFNELFLS